MTFEIRYNPIYQRVASVMQGTVMQIGKALINDRLRVSKVC